MKKTLLISAFTAVVLTMTGCGSSDNGGTTGTGTSGGTGTGGGTIGNSEPIRAEVRLGVCRIPTPNIMPNFPVS